MSIFSRRRENSGGRAPELTEQALPQEMAPDFETQEKISRLNEKIESSENLLNALGRVAREQILTDPEALEEIYASKEIGKTGLKGEYDASVFESAGPGLRARNAIKRIMTLGVSGSKHAMRDEWGGAGMVDKRKLKAEVKGKKYELDEAVNRQELEKAAEEFGLKPEAGVTKSYAEGKRGVEKVISREKTEAEMDKTAGQILVRRLGNLETLDGIDLLQQKQGLERFEKELNSTREAFEPEDMAKFEGEKQERHRLIEDKQQKLNSDLEVIRRPLLEQQRGLTEALANLSPLLENTLTQEEAFKIEIRGLQEKMNKVSRTQEISKSDVAKERIKQWAEQKSLAAANEKAYEEAKKKLNIRLTELKRSLAEVDRTLARINRIGKTPAELMAKKERQPAERAQAQERRRAGPAQAEAGGFEVPIRHIPPETTAPEATDDKVESAKPKTMATRRRIAFRTAELHGRESDLKMPAGQPRPKRVAAPAAEAEAPSAPEATDDYDDLAAEERRKINLDQGGTGPKVEDEAKGGWFGRVRRWFKPEGKKISGQRFKPERGLAGPKPQPTAEAAKVEAPKPEKREPGRRKEEEIIMPVKTWFLKIFPQGVVQRRFTIWENCFRLPGKPFDPNAKMSESEVKEALIDYLLESSSLESKPGQNQLSPKGASRLAADLMADAYERMTDNLRKTSMKELEEALTPDSARQGQRAEAQPKRTPDSGSRERRRRLGQLKNEDEAGEEEGRKKGQEIIDSLAASTKEAGKARAEVKSSSINGTKEAFEKAEALAKKKAKKRDETSGIAEATPETAPNLEQAGTDKQEKADVTVKKWLDKFDLKLTSGETLKNDSIKEHFTLPGSKFKKNVVMTPGQAEEAYVKFLVNFNRLPEEEARKKVKVMMESE